MADHINGKPFGEFDIINTFFAPLSKGFEGAYNLSDDCAYYSHSAKTQTVINTDTIVAGVHFFPDDDPSSIAYKALAVNLSDLAAKAATPRGYLLSISLTKNISIEWLKAFSEGLQRVQEKFQLSLIGGDTVSTSGPLTISITMLGETDSTRKLLRSNAQGKDSLYVTGTIGDSYLGLQLIKSKNCFDFLSSSQKEFLIDRYLHPRPRLEFKNILVEYVNASIDISDGLLIDIQKLTKTSGLGGELWVDRVPLSSAADTVVKNDPAMLSNILSGGDDYELLFTVSNKNLNDFEESIKASGLKVEKIGILNSTGTIQFQLQDGTSMRGISVEGYDHFK